MRRRIVTFSAAVVLGALAPPPADAIEYFGRIGGAYDRTDSWAPDVPHGMVPGLSLDLGAAARGFFVSPGIVDWDLGASYNDQKTTYGEAVDRADAVSYAATLGLLQGRGTKAHLELSAARSRSEYARDAEANRTTGAGTNEGYSVSGGVGFPGLPVLTSSFATQHTTSSGFDRADTWEDRKMFGVGLHSGQGNLDTVMDYQSEWDRGSLTPVNFVSQSVNLSSSMKPEERFGASVNAAYFLREASVHLPGNPRYETSVVNVTGGLEGSNVENRAWGAYRYRHNLTEDPGLPDREALSHTVEAHLSQRPVREWDLFETASASFSEQRNGTDRIRASGQGVSLGAGWGRNNYGATLGLGAGAIKPESGPSAFAYGANASGHGRWVHTNKTIGASYGITYASNLDATPGWATTQQASADLTETLGPLLSWSLRLQGSGARGGGGAFGSNASRLVQAGADLRYRYLFFGAGAGLSDSVTGALANPLSDGLFLPAGYDTHSRYVTASVSTTIRSGLTASADWKYTLLSGPLTADQQEVLYHAMLAYSLGKWTFSLEDRYTLGGTVALDHRVNAFYLRASRVFGGRD